MKISVRVKPNSKDERVEKVAEGEFVVRVKAPAKEGKANEAAVGALSEYFGVAKSRIVIVKGHNSRNKVVVVY